MNKNYNQFSDEVEINISNIPQVKAQYDKDIERQIRFVRTEKERMVKEREGLVNPKNNENVEYKNRKKMKHPDYNPYQIPPNWDEARNHYDSQQVGLEYTEKELQDINIDIEYCICCGMQVNKKKLSINEETEYLGFLGSGFSLFFDFYKFSFGLIFVTFITSGIYGISSNLMGNNCLTFKQINDKYDFTDTTINKVIKDYNLCQFSYFTMLSFANKINNHEFIQIQNIMNFSTVIIIIIGLQFFRKIQREINIVCDDLFITAHDYAICLKYIPNNKIGADYEEEIKKELEKLKFTIPNISLAYNLQDFMNAEYNMEQSFSKKQDIIYCKINNKKMPDKLSNKGQLNYDQAINLVEADFNQKKQVLDRIQDEFEGGVSNKFTGIAYVTFATEKQRDDFIDKYEVTSLWEKIKNLFNKYNPDKTFYILGKPVVVEQAPEPSDVFWENQGVKTAIKIRNRLFAKIIDIIVQCFILVIVGWLILQQNKFNQNITIKNYNEYEMYITLLSISIAIITAIFNQILIKILTFVTSIEKWSTYTKFNKSLAYKITIEQFINTGFINFLICFFFIKNYYANGGLLYTVNLIFIADFIAQFLSCIICPTYQIQRFKRWYYSRQAEKSILTQQEAHQIFENPEFPIAANYGMLIKSMFCVMFYAPVLPIGIIIIQIQILIIYWLQKYNLLNRHTVKHQQSADLSLKMTELLECINMIQTIANFSFEYIITKQINHIALTGVVLGVINFIAPNNIINQMVFKTRRANQNIGTYYEQEHLLEIDYRRANPAISKLSVKNFLDKYQK